jgi:protein-glutamine gamma-glutamyltransferase
MSAAAARLPRFGTQDATGERAAAERPEPSDWLRLAAFFALAAWGAAHWAGLVEDASFSRSTAGVLLATAAGALLILIGRSPLPGLARHSLAAVIGTVTVALGLVIAGLPAGLLKPARWDELGDGLDRGLSGVRVADWPYAGDDEWVRLVILFGAPLLLGLAATLSFWPARRGRSLLRAAGLVVLLFLYGMAVTEHDPGAPLIRGLALLALVAAWLWLPRLGPREALPAAAVVLAVGVAALPVAASLNAEAPWWDYRSWHWWGGKDVAYDWEHSYGPLDWPRDGTTLLNIRSDRQHYWKVEALDSFDGFRWLRSDQNNYSRSDVEMPDADELNRRWLSQVRVTVRALRSDFVVGFGTTLNVDGLDQTITSSDGTTRSLDEPLERGDSYEVSAYAPNPSARQMRAAGPDTEFGLLEYTTLYLPKPGESALEGSGAKVDDSLAGEVGREAVTPGLRDGVHTAIDRAAEQTLRGSAYGEVYRLTRRLTNGQPTTYDAVKTVESYLQNNYTYNERPPSQELPLAAFLFEDRIGYCQQFSGAMALMLRMAGIPTRVATGFSPGSYNRDSKEYRVRDLDAHSWVEVHFAGIGWVPFDPTPTAAPAESQSSGTAATSAARGDAGDALRSPAPATAEPQAGGAVPGADGDSPGPLAVAAAVAGLAALLGLAWLGWGIRRRRTMQAGEALEAQVGELERALHRLGWRVPSNTTLLVLEERLARAAGPASAGYAARLRAHRFARDERAPGHKERRALRRELTARRGPLTRVRGYLALPPFGPRAEDS